MKDDLPNVVASARRLHDAVTRHALTQEQARETRIQALKDLVHEFEWVELPPSGIKLPGYKLYKRNSIWTLVVFLPCSVVAGIVAWHTWATAYASFAGILSALFGVVGIVGWFGEASGNCIKIGRRWVGGRSGSHPDTIVVYGGNHGLWNPPWIDPADTVPPIRRLDVREALEKAAILYEAALAAKADPEDLEETYRDF